MAIVDGERLAARFPTSDRTPRLPGARTFATVLVFVACGALFVLSQDLLAVRFHHALHRMAASHGPLPVGFQSAGLVQASEATEALILYGGFAGAGVVLARLGRRFLFAAPAIVFVAGGFLHGSPLPQAIGSQWGSCSALCDAWYTNPWLAAAAGLVLVLLPGAWVARRAPGHRLFDRGDTPALAALAVAIVLGTIAYRTTVVVNGGADLQATLTVAAFGILVGTARYWWPWSQAAFALVLSGALTVAAWNVLFGGTGTVGFVIHEAMPLALVGVLVALWEPIASVLRRAVARPFALLVACNALNVADAILTAVVVRAGHGTELNPVVRWMGLPAKLILVGLLTWALCRTRSSGLIWVTAALFAVVCYHVSGFIVNH